MLQIAGAEQSASLAHTFLQTFVPHLNGKHELAPGVTQAPLPSQVDVGVKVVPVVGQVEPLQTVSFGYFWQAPDWHLPFVAQLPGPMSMHLAAGSAAPFGTFVHVPRLPGSAHD
jgi:hypothetical protein